MKLSYAVLLSLLLAVALFVSECDGAGGKRRRRGRKHRRRQKMRNRNRGHPLPPQDCGPIPHIEHAHALQTPDRDIHYACEPGFELQGTNVITCIDGRWTVAPRCVRQVCPTPLLVAFANPPQLSSSSTVVTYTCQSGYRIVNGNGATSQTLNCNLALRQWPTLPQCEAIPSTECGAPPTIMHASVQVSGHMATYTCHTGYVKKAGTPSVIQCHHGKWTYTVAPACVVDPKTTTPSPKCLKAPGCGGSTIMRGDVADSYDVGNTVKYTCITGYRLVGSNDNTKKSVDIKCKEDGTWETIPTCEPVVCGQPSHTLGGNTQITAAAALTFGSQYTYTCLNLYETTAPTVATCNADGQWSITPPTCTLKFCPYSALPTLANGAPYMVTANANIPVGTKVTFQCNSNYRIAPSTSVTETSVLQFITCQEDGTFTAFPNSCVYTRPSSCVDYFTRDTVTFTLPTSVSVIIDTDGAGTNPETTVLCTRSSTQTCTEIIASATSNSLTGPAACATPATPILPGVAFSFTVPPPLSSETAAVCDTATVTYDSTAAEITALITSSMNCVQTVNIACNGIDADVDANFLALQLNGQSGTARGQAGSTIGATGDTDMIAPSDENLRAASAPCDCGISGGTTCDTGCTCSTPDGLGAAGADTITIPITESVPQYVTAFARVAGDKTGALSLAPALEAGEYDVTVSNIQCCVAN